jgi:hypothetical protein
MHVSFPYREREGPCAGILCQLLSASISSLIAKFSYEINMRPRCCFNLIK